MSLLPPIGAEIPCSMHAIDAKIEVEGNALALEFKGGIKQRVDVNPNDPVNSVRLRIVGFNVSGKADGVSVTLQQSDVDVDARSSLRVTQRFPPEFEQRDVLEFTATFEKEEGDPVTLVAKKPMVLIAGVTRYPPRGDLYRLEAPVELTSPDDPDTIVGRINIFNCKKAGM
ncbi:hypothetical protein [Streptomyces sp. NPDC040750]|uniref:hypothetical protein n=1 Tax=Streptomyces sp. NPDC040750 TaxID=3154491 RepID=UPI00340DEB0A